ncbi:pyridoxal-phosphate dependent enzyme [Kitasatospora sp. NPDC048540]|uniref:pyridoxal-phosphate dependent enzyme n=1 Tax=unclassified Kitasatospora TaxID=2633591 RepID=UPI00068E7395|nr:pyridoxal-phosphate dependent enzyme [Kitasatospora sp. MBT63]
MLRLAPSPTGARPLTTPLVRLGGSLGWRELFVKDETKQRSGAFKYRGVWRRTGLLPAGTTLITASTGNHACALAEAARARGQHARIHVPATTPRAKLDRIAAMGGEIVPVDGGYDECEALARAEADAGAGVFVHSFDDPEIIAGHRTLFREAGEQFRTAGEHFREAGEQAALPDAVYVPLGGGGLITAAIRQWGAAGVRIVGVEYDGAPAMRRSLAAGRRIILDRVSGLPEGLLVRRIGRHPFDACHARRQRVVTVDDAELHRAMALLWTEAGIRAEGAGAAALAAALREGTPDERALAVVSGGNIDESVWRECLAAAGRHHPDPPRHPWNITVNTTSPDPGPQTPARPGASGPARPHPAPAIPANPDTGHRARLGLVGGVGPIATSDFYLRLVSGHRRATGGSYPDVVTHSLPLPADLEHAFITGTAGPGHREEIDALLREALDVFERAGSDFVALPCNTLHARLPDLLRGRDLEWIDMVAAVGRTLTRNRYRRVLLLGTTSTVRSGLYRDGDGVEFALPQAAAQREAEQLVLACLEGDLGAFPAARLRALAASAGPVDAVVLACTDLHLLRDSTDFGVPVVDSLSCLVEACTERLLTSHRPAGVPAPAPVPALAGAAR